MRLVPEVAVEPRPADEPRYVRSYVFTRFSIGLLGVLLPPLLVFLEPALFDGQPFPRGSLSAYYYSGFASSRRRLATRFLRPGRPRERAATHRECGVTRARHRGEPADEDRTGRDTVSVTSSAPSSPRSPAHGRPDKESGERIAIWAFGAAWLAKGAEWNVLFRRTAALSLVPADPPPESPTVPQG